jgi:hypothetical protein
VIPPVAEIRKITLLLLATKAFIFCSGEASATTIERIG